MKATKARTRQASVRTRDRLAAQLRDISGCRLAEVRITPALYGGGTTWCAMAFGVDRTAPWNRREVPLPGVHGEIASLLRKAFPSADWDRAQDYDVVTGLLSEHVTELPACLRGDAL